MFNKAFIPALVLAAASVAVPAAASAQSHHSQNRGPSYERVDRNWTPISQRKFELDRRIDRGQRNGSLTRREANSLKADLNSLVRLESRYRQGGLSARERSELDRRYDQLEARIRWERNDRQNRRR